MQSEGEDWEPTGRRPAQFRTTKQILAQEITTDGFIGPGLCRQFLRSAILPTQWPWCLPDERPVFSSNKRRKWIQSKMQRMRAKRRGVRWRCVGILYCLDKYPHDVWTAEVHFVGSAFECFADDLRGRYWYAKERCWATAATSRFWSSAVPLLDMVADVPTQMMSCPPNAWRQRRISRATSAPCRPGGVQFIKDKEAQSLSSSDQERSSRRVNSSSSIM